ncbi:MAG: YncE family protein [Chthoniobacteraceae bacterium]
MFAAENLYSGSLNCATVALLTALGLSDQVPANDVAQVDASAEVTWSFGGEKFRSITFSATIEAPITDLNAAASPDPELYPPPSEVARKSDIPVVGTAARLDAGVPSGAATLDGTGKLEGAQVPDSLALKSDIVPNGSNRIVIVDRFSLATLPTTDANGNSITKVNISDVVHQIGVQETRRTAVLNFRDYTITDDDVNNAPHIQFCDENWNCAGFGIVDFGGSGTLVSATDFAYALVNAINSGGLNVSGDVTGDDQLTITSNTTGPLPSDWNFSQDIDLATYSETEGVSALPPGDFIVADLNNLGDATGYQGIGDTVDFLSGYGTPTLEIGEEGDGYVDENNGDFYHRDASGWQFVLNIKGPKGNDGVNLMRVAVGDSTQIGPLLWKCKPPTYAVGTHSQGICFDGANIWVTNNGSNNVTKITAATGAVVGTYSVGTAPVGICFDGTNIWVANSGSNNVTKLTASNGAAVGTYTVGTSPQYLCYDSTNIWVTNAGSNNVMRLTASTGAIAGTYVTDSNPAGVCFDGTNIWVANCNYTTQSLSKFVAATGDLVGTYSYKYNVNSPLGICFDGTNIWTANSGSFGVGSVQILSHFQLMA